MAGGSRARLPVISATISIRPRGGMGEAAEAGDQAHDHEGGGHAGHARGHRVQEPSEAEPEEAADDHAGSEDAAGTPRSDR